MSTIKKHDMRVSARGLKQLMDRRCTSLMLRYSGSVRMVYRTGIGHIATGNRAVENKNTGSTISGMRLSRRKSPTKSAMVTFSDVNFSVTSSVIGITVSVYYDAIRFTVFSMVRNLIVHSSFWNSVTKTLFSVMLVGLSDARSTFRQSPSQCSPKKMPPIELQTVLPTVEAVSRVGVTHTVQSTGWLLGLGMAFISVFTLMFTVSRQNMGLKNLAVTMF